MSYFDLSATCAQFDHCYTSLQIAKIISNQLIKCSTTCTFHRHQNKFDIFEYMSIPSFFKMSSRSAIFFSFNENSTDKPHNVKWWLMQEWRNVFCFFSGKQKLAGSAFQTSMRSSFETQHTVGLAVNSPTYHIFHITLQWSTANTYQALNWQTTSHNPSSWMLYTLNIFFQMIGRVF